MVLDQSKICCDIILNSRDIILISAAEAADISIMSREYAEKTMKWLCVFALITAFWAGAADSVEISEENWKTYRNEKYGYELSYPPGMEYKEYVGGSSGDLNYIATGKGFISFEVWPPGECPRQPEGTTAREIGIARAKTVTQADGPDSSFYCGDPLKVREFSSTHGVKLFELELTCMREVYPVWDEESAGQDASTAEAESEIIIEGKKGPTYFADISQSWRKRILLADPVASRSLSQAATETPLDTNILSKILDTLRTFAIPKPQGICIEDLTGEIR